MKLRFHQEIKPSEKITAQQIVDLIIARRQIKNKAEFFHPSSPLNIALTDFKRSYGTKMRKVVEQLKQIRKRQQTVVVYTDYDADGITGGAILWETLHLLGFKVMPYVPHRKNEGYGFSLAGIDHVKQLYDPALIISVDHGITAKEKVSYYW